MKTAPVAKQPGGFLKIVEKLKYSALLNVK